MADTRAMRVAVCEPDTMFRARISSVLRDGGCRVVIITDDPDTLMERLRRLRIRPSIVVMDADQATLEVCRQLAGFGTILLRLATTVRPDHLVSLEESGGCAHGYLSKSLNVVDRLPEIVPLLPCFIVTSQAYSSELWRYAQRAHEAPLTLSGREARALLLVGQGLQNRQIAERMHVSAGSVKSYLNRAYSKIGVSTRIEAILYVERHGHSLAQLAPQR